MKVAVFRHFPDSIFSRGGRAVVSPASESNNNKSRENGERGREERSDKFSTRGKAKASLLSPRSFTLAPLVVV